MGLLHKTKLEKLKVLLFDIDGILTDGRLFWASEEVGFNRFFNAHDGHGLKMMMAAGYKVGVISGGDSVGVRKRFIDNLKLDYIYLGLEDKRGAYLEVLSKGFKAEEVLYMGDEVFDIPLLRKSGFSATVPEAPSEVQESVDYITTKLAGKGAVREVLDMLRYACDIPLELLDFE